MHLEVDQIRPARRPLRQQTRIVALHDLETTREVVGDPARDVVQSIGSEPTLIAKAAVHRERVAAAEALDDHVQHPGSITRVSSVSARRAPRVDQKWFQRYWFVTSWWNCTSAALTSVPSAFGQRSAAVQLELGELAVHRLAEQLHRPLAALEEADRVEDVVGQEARARALGLVLGGRSAALRGRCGSSV